MTTPYDNQPVPQGPPDEYRTSTPNYSAPAYTESAYSVPAPAEGAAAPASAPNTGAHPPVRGFDDKGHVKRGRVSMLWITLIVTAIGLILLIIFIAQNSRIVPIHFLGLAGHLAVGLTVLIAAVVGLLLAAIPGTIRILQLRKALTTNVPKGRRTS